ncbi:MAG: AI-2E family transporter [Butyrivibrio sp.]|nr:AI-2E family transporter [Butyrivibrio sp.]
MKFRFNKKYIYWGLTGGFAISLGILFYYILFHRENLSSAVNNVISISMPIIDGLILAYLMTPILNTIENKLLKPIYIRGKVEINEKSKRRMRSFSIILTIVVVLIVAYEFLGMIIPELITSIQNIYSQFPTYIKNLTDWVTGLLENNPELESTVMQLLNQYSTMLNDFLNTSILPRLNDILKVLSSSVVGLFKATWNFIIGFIVSIYIMGNKELFAGQAKKAIYALFEKASANQIIANVRFVHSTFSGFIVGKIIDSAIIGVICFICTTIIGTPYSILVSVVIGVTNVIPFFGPWLGAVPCALLILMVNPLQCLYFIIMILIIQQVDGNIIGPKILGDSTGLSSFWVIFAITVFGGIFGILGMIVGVPIFAVLYAAIKSVINKQLAKKELPTSTEPYLMVGSIAEDNTFDEYMPEKKKRKSRTAKKPKKEVDDKQ